MASPCCQSAAGRLQGRIIEKGVSTSKGGGMLKSQLYISVEVVSKSAATLKYIALLKSGLIRRKFFRHFLKHRIKRAPKQEMRGILRLVKGRIHPDISLPSLAATPFNMQTFGRAITVKNVQPLVKQSDCSVLSKLALIDTMQVP